MLNVEILETLNLAILIPGHRLPNGKFIPWKFFYGESLLETPILTKSSPESYNPAENFLQGISAGIIKLSK